MVFVVGFGVRGRLRTGRGIFTRQGVKSSRGWGDGVEGVGDGGVGVVCVECGHFADEAHGDADVFGDVGGGSDVSHFDCGFDEHVVDGGSGSGRCGDDVGELGAEDGVYSGDAVEGCVVDGVVYAGTCVGELCDVGEVRVRGRRGRLRILPRLCLGSNWCRWQE